MDYLFPDNLEEQERRSNPSEGSSHICRICGKEFASERNVARHVKVLHEPYSKQRVRTPRIHICRFCGAGFASINNMTTHVKAAHESNPTKRKHFKEIHESNGRHGGKRL